MLQLTLRTLRYNATRLALSSLAIVLGIGFVTGTLIFSDGLDAATEQRVGRLDRNIDVELTRDPDTVPDAPDPSADPEVGLATGIVDTVDTVPGVAVAEGSFVWHGVGLLGPDGRPVSGFHLVHTIPADQRLHGFDLTAGQLPHGAGEVVLDARTADRRDISVGDQVQARVGDRPLLTFQVVGLADLAGSSIDYGDGMLGMSLADAQRLTGRTDVDRIIVVADPGVDQAELAERVAAAVGPTAITRTGAQLQAAALDKAVGNGDQFAEVLLIFAAIAVFVAAFVIANTFTILLAQRTRETALLRLVGATRAQLFKAAVVEAAVVGLIGAVWGLLVGVAAAAGLRQAYALLGSGIPSGTVIGVRTVVVALVCGVGVTVGAALLPAWRGTAVPPVAALTDAALTVARPVGRVRLGAGLLLLAAGALGLVAAAPTGSLTVVFVGGILAFLGLVLASPLVVPAVTRILGAATRWAAGPAARLAVANAVRNPRRAAATAMALVIGIGLVTAFTVGAHSVKQSVEREVNAQIGAAFLLSSDIDPVPADLVDRLRDLPEIGMVLSSLEAYDAPGGLNVVASHPLLLTKVGAPVADGDLAALGPGRAVVAEGSGYAVGDRIRLEPMPTDSGEVDPEPTAGQAREVEVVALLAVAESPPDDAAESAWITVLVSESDFTAVYPQVGAWTVQVEPAAGIDAPTARAAVEEIVVGQTTVEFLDRAAYAKARTSTVDTVLQFVSALLALAILISLLGLANTLTLSVVERTRENALLRAVGLTRGQLRGMLATEAVLTAAGGVVCGIVIGIAGALSAIAVLNDTNEESFGLALPWTQLGVIIAVAAVAALVASVLPARRALRQPIVTSLAAE